MIVQRKRMTNKVGQLVEIRSWLLFWQNVGGGWGQLPPYTTPLYSTRKVFVTFYLVKYLTLFSLITAPVARMIKFYNIPLLTAGGMIYDYNDPKKDFDDEFHLLVNAGYSFYQIGEFFFRNKSSPEENKSVFQRYVLMW